MRIPRFFVSFELFESIESIDSQRGEVVLSDRAIVAQISNVLRLKTGSYIDLLDGRGTIYRCTISEVTTPAKRSSPSTILARIESVMEAAGEARTRCTIALPVLRPANFEWALQKLTELGAAKIVPLITQHSVGREAKLDRWHSIVREAAEQCERGLIPEITTPVSLKEYLDTLTVDVNGVNFICTERSEASPLHVVLCNFEKKAPHKISVIVGAEGGFTSEEVELAQNAFCMPISLGKRILRAETAAIYTMAIIDAVLED